MIIDHTQIRRGSIGIRGGTLRLETPDRGEVRVVIADKAVIVGRDKACDVVVADPHVSAMHAELVATERGVRLRDLGSSNGTFARGLRIAEAFIVEETHVEIGSAKGTIEVGEASRVSVATADRFGSLYGKNPKMRVLFGRLAVIAPSDLTVLVQGETGTGKELVAQAVHEASPRKKGPFVVVDCGALPPSLAEGLLFGHVKGAFTGANNARQSPFVQANGGTIFLDELGELPLDVQPKLLRALAEKRVKPVGGDEFVPFDARVVAATRRDLVSAVNDGSFRSDLYFRVAQAVVEIPALRERTDDLPDLVREILGTMNAARAWSRVKREDVARLLRHDWPGNVRELRSAVAVALTFAGDDNPLDIAEHVLGLGAVATGTATALGYHEAKKEALGRFERGYFAMMSAECAGRVAEIARRAGLQRAHVRRYLATHGLLVPRSQRGRV